MTRRTFRPARRWRGRRPPLFAAALAAGATASVLAAAAPPAAARPTAASPRSGPAMRAACRAAQPGYYRCFTLYRPETAVNLAIAAGLTGSASQPKGWSPRALQAAYNLPVARSSDQTVAVSIAFDTPKLEQYLAVYRKHYGLPPCTTTNGCLRKVNQQGQASPLPRSGVHTGWDAEATLDVSMISAACPHCKILVVEANDPSIVNLAATENTAVRLGAGVVSNSYGARETGFSQALAGAYNHPHHTLVASSGDFGFTAAQSPANLTTVTAVGGTKLSRADTARGWSETVWHQGFGASGSGCSAYVAKPPWQHDQHCPGRTVADISAVATNVPIYNADYGGWITIAGTSISAPLVAGIYGLAGNATTAGGPARLYRHTSHLFDITTGNNAVFGTPEQTCGDDYLCTASKGYDAPTGLGTPNGTGAF
jgi:subtilase family serine protease